MINESSPKCKEDWWSVNFVRTYSDCILTSGKILRNEPNSYHPDIPASLGFPTDIYFNEQNG